MEHYEEILNTLAHDLESIYCFDEFIREDMNNLILGIFRARACMNQYGMVPDLEELYRLTQNVAEDVHSRIRYSWSASVRHERLDVMMALGDAVSRMLLCLSSSVRELRPATNLFEDEDFDPDDEDIVI